MPGSSKWSPSLRSPHQNPVCSCPLRSYVQRTQYISTSKTNQLILFREIITVYCENRRKNINTPRG
jgi:hypothetical protein